MTILASGQLQITETAIFTFDGTEVLSGNTIEIDRASFVNTIVSPQTITLFVKSRFGVSREVRQYRLQQNDCGEYVEPGQKLTFENGDSLRAQATTADAVDFIVLGNRI